MTDSIFRDALGNVLDPGSDFLETIAGLIDGEAGGVPVGSLVEALASSNDAAAGLGISAEKLEEPICCYRSRLCFALYESYHIAASDIGGSDVLPARQGVTT